MPDISMCSVEGCAVSHTCRRHADSGTVPCEHRQSYLVPRLTIEGGEFVSCEDYLEVRDQ